MEIYMASTILDSDPRTKLRSGISSPFLPECHTIHGMLACFNSDRIVTVGRGFPSPYFSSLYDRELVQSGDQCKVGWAVPIKHKNFVFMETLASS
jgi:hypothetical protein